MALGRDVRRVFALHGAQAKALSTEEVTVSMHTSKTPAAGVCTIMITIAMALTMSACSEDENLAPYESALGTTYEVGPTRTYTTLQALLAAHTLAPGDVVNVDYSASYPAGVTFTSSGTAADPIIIHGIPNGSGLRPVIKSAINSTAAPNNVHFKYADHYVFENFEIDGSANQGNGWNGTAGTFRCIFHQGDGITLRNLYIHDCPAHGLASADDGSGSLTLEYSEFARSGGSDNHHPIYAETDPINHPNAVFRMQYCYIHDGVGGNLVKSRAERNEIYYNWIEESTYHDLELIGWDSSDAPPRPMNSDVVGNVIYQPSVGLLDTTAVRIGHDWVEPSGLPGSHGRYRFVGNTFVLFSGTTAAVIKAEGALESVEMHDNVFYSPGTALRILQDNASDPAQWTTGSAQIAGSQNWATTGSTVPTQWTGTTLGSSPGFTGASDFHPVSTSPLVDHGTTSAPSFPAFPFPNPLYPPGFVPPARTATTTATARPVVGTLDIGAYEYGSGGGCSYAINPTSAAPAAAGGAASVTVTAGAGCGWTATSNAAWLTITSGPSGTGNGSVGYTVAANTGGARTGTLTIASQTFTVNQQGASGGGSLADFYIDQTDVTFYGGDPNTQAAVVAEGIGGSNAVKHTALQIWDGTKRIHRPTALDITGVQATDKLRISLDVSPGRVSRIYIYFNDDWQTFVFTPVLDQVAGYETFDIDIGSTMRSQMGNTINDIYFKAGDGFPDNGTLWVDEIKFIRP